MKPESILKRINLHIKGRISEKDAKRQHKTAEEILTRLKTQPGVILADEVGMGKTFVALAVAASVAQGNKGRRPVVVMVPPSLREKWPSDFRVFNDKCIKDKKLKIRSELATRAEDFLKMLDDPPGRRKSIVFITHGAMSRGLTDKWIKLALIQKALRYKKNIRKIRKAVKDNIAELLRYKYFERDFEEGTWDKLMSSKPRQWLKILKACNIQDSDESKEILKDDPVPKSVCLVLKKINTERIFDALTRIPLRHSANYKSYMDETRKEITDELRETWEQTIKNLRLRLPLLILDEAHHLKNPDTDLASLFKSTDAKNDAEEISKGPLGNVFERMLFLTATPFQLGHGELCSVLDRFKDICWKARGSPRCGREGYSEKIEALRKALDCAQQSALTLDTQWADLNPDDLTASNKKLSDIEEWWKALSSGLKCSAKSNQVLELFIETKQRMKEAEILLKPWVIRHRKERLLPNSHTPRREKFIGDAIITGKANDHNRGLQINEEGLLPFLLAARAAFCTPDERPVFAEGLASSYEAFLNTRLAANARTEKLLTDGDDDFCKCPENINESRWYLDRLQELLPKGNIKKASGHPKIDATVKRVVSAWKDGEKVLVFCHYIATGKVLRAAISLKISDEILSMAKAEMGLPKSQAGKELERIGRLFEKPGSPARIACDKVVDSILTGYPTLKDYKEEIKDIIRRIIRTPTYLVRLFPLKNRRICGKIIASIFDKGDGSGLNLKSIFKDFLDFLNEKCASKEEREEYIKTVSSIQTGTHYGKKVMKTYSKDELQEEKPEKLLPNVRLVNGTTKQETRRKLMLAFNTPFYPEILIASSVMAEGVDLQKYCRYVIHHDLCWNPSTLEQRTGRIDRVDSKAERSVKSINVYLPYIAETQDEKMYRVVTDRERWFNVVMGEKFNMDVRTTEKMASRIPFPESAAKELAFKLEVVKE